MLKRVDPVAISQDARDHAPEFHPAEEWTLASIASVLRRRLLTIALITLAAMLGGGIYLLQTPPRFTAVAGLVIDTKRAHPYPTGAAPDSMVDMGVVDSQVEMIKSEKIALAVIRKLELASDPEFVEVKRDPLTDLLAFLGLRSIDSLDSDEARLRRAVFAFQRSLGVTRIGRSYVTEVSFTSDDPRKAARIANEIANAYIDDHLDSKIYNTQRASDWIKQRLSDLRQHVERAVASIASFKAESGALIEAGTMTAGEREMKLQELESSAQTYRTIYDTFLNLSRYVQTLQEQSFPVTEARIVTEAAPPLSKSSPKSAVVMMLSLLVGLSLGVVVAFGREYADRTVRLRDQLERRLGVKCLGFLLFSRKRAAAQSAAHGPKFPALYQDHRPYYGAADVLRAIRAAIDESGRADLGRVIAITSPLANEGKTTLAINLATVIGQSGRRALVIDADLRERSLSKLLGSGDAPGLLEALDGDRTIDQAVQPWRFGWYLSCQPVKDGDLHPGDVLGSPAMRDVLQQARTKYDYIIVDYPSMLRHSDVQVSVHVMDSVILLAEFGRTTIDDLAECLAKSPALTDRLAGIVVNKTKPRALREQMHRRLS